MDYTERLQNVSVLGAAGKMGSGILLLTAVEMADLSLLPGNKNKTFVLNAIDLSEKGLAGLMKYLRAQVHKLAEKKTVWLRQMYADRKDLIENGEIIEEYVFDVLNIVRPQTSLLAARNSNLVFEAVSENPKLKQSIFEAINNNNENKAWFFTNTSSIPIHQINADAGLEGRVLGFHFYNPPAVQKLVELITIKENSEEMKTFALEFARKLRKIVVPSNDIAGFIGNGHFMRDALFGIQMAERLSKEMPLHEAIYVVNKISQDFLVRPMGIFQLIDYVGIDVVQYIMMVMNPHLPEEALHSPLLDKMMELDIKGGQNSNGSQKNGFLAYDRGRIKSVYCPRHQKYVAVDELAENAASFTGALPDGHIAWKAIIRNRKKDEHFANYFAGLAAMNSKGARLAIEYGANSDRIGKLLVDSGVAKNEADVNTVMLTGFFHAYGPINNYFVAS